MAQALNQGLSQALRQYPELFLMGEDIGAMGGAFEVTKGLLDEFGPERIRDCPISEQAFTLMAVGAAQAGMRPVVEILFADFLLVAADAIINHWAKTQYMQGPLRRPLPLTLRVAMGGGYGDAATQSQSLYSLFAHIPGLKIVVPSTPANAKGLLLQAIDDPDPVLIFEHKLLYGFIGLPPGSFGFVQEEPYRLPIGPARIARAGTDVTIVSCGLMTHRVLEAVQMLELDGISAEVVDLTTIVPLDRETISVSCEKTGRLVVVDEDYIGFGLAAEVITSVVESGVALKLPPIRLAPSDSLGYAYDLENHAIPTVATIISALRKSITPQHTG